MMFHSEQFANDHEVPGLTPDLRELDVRLARRGCEARDDAPAGLGDRVFAASAGLLPQRPVLATIGRSRGVVQWWGRAAMAASLGLVVVIASTLTKSPGVDFDPALVAYQQELQPSLFDDVAREENAVSHLLTTANLSSYDEVAGEIESLLAEVGM